MRCSMSSESALREAHADRGTFAWTRAATAQRCDWHCGFGESALTLDVVCMKAKAVLLGSDGGPVREGGPSRAAGRRRRRPIRQASGRVSPHSRTPSFSRCNAEF